MVAQKQGVERSRSALCRRQGKSAVLHQIVADGTDYFVVDAFSAVVAKRRIVRVLGVTKVADHFSSFLSAIKGRKSRWRTRKISIGVKNGFVNGFPESGSLILLALFIKT